MKGPEPWALTIAAPRSRNISTIIAQVRHDFAANPVLSILCRTGHYVETDDVRLQQTSGEGGLRVSWYRVYFLALGGDIRNADDFDVAGDEVALALADGIHDAVSDLYAGYEVWQDSRLVFRCANPGAPRPSIPNLVITERIQAELLRRELILQKSDSAFARSRRLTERIHQLQDVVGSFRSRKAASRGGLDQRKRA